MFEILSLKYLIHKTTYKICTLASNDKSTNFILELLPHMLELKIDYFYMLKIPYTSDLDQIGIKFMLLGKSFLRFTWSLHYKNLSYAVGQIESLLFILACYVQ